MPFTCGCRSFLPTVSPSAPVLYSLCTYPRKSTVHSITGLVKILLCMQNILPGFEGLGNLVRCWNYILTCGLELIPLELLMYTTIPLTTMKNRLAELWEQREHKSQLDLNGLQQDELDPDD